MILPFVQEPSSPQLFITGLPRSGTTLVYQYIVHRLHVSYFTNGVGRFPQMPCLITLLQRRRHGDYRSDFKSHYGKVKGAVAPREAGGFWGRFLGTENYVRFNQLSSREVNQLRKHIFCVQSVFKDTPPFVNKNVKHLLRIDALSKVFPEAKFLIVERDLRDVSLSLLRGRYNNLRDPREWWSIKPPDYQDFVDLPVVEQIANQIRSTHRQMHRDLAQLPPEKVLYIGYEAFCDNPEALVSLLRKEMGHLADRNEPVDQFTISSNKPQTEEEEQLVDLVQFLLQNGDLHRHSGSNGGFFPDDSLPAR